MTETRRETTPSLLIYQNLGLRAKRDPAFDYWLHAYAECDVETRMVIEGLIEYLKGEVKGLGVLGAFELVAKLSEFIVGSKEKRLCDKYRKALIDE
jgi:hypothetical protein